MRLISIGEILWDVIREKEHLGGALLNLSVHAVRLGHEVCLVSAVGTDTRGDRALKAASALGLSTDLILHLSQWPTGIVTVTVDPDGQPTFAIHRPAAYDSIRLDSSKLARLASKTPDWICYGTLLSMCPCGRKLLFETMEAIAAAQRSYDVNLRKNCFAAELVLELLRRANVVKLNDLEAPELGSIIGNGAQIREIFCRETWVGSCSHHSGGARVRRADPRRVGGRCGRRGERFRCGVSSRPRHRPAAEIGGFTNRSGALVASRPGGVAEWSLVELQRLSERC